MARMFPEWIGEEERASEPKFRAEYKMYDALEGSLSEDDWYVFYSRRWTWVEARTKRIRTREVDFIIAHPEYGILLMEVKGGRIEVSNGQWTSTDRDGKKWEISPYEQVAIALAALERRLDEERPNPFRDFRFSTAVCFPDVVLREDTVQLEVKHRSVTLDASALEHLRKRVIAAMRDGKGLLAAPGEARILALKELVACSWYIDTPQSIQITETENSIKRLTQNQFKLLYELAPSARRLLVSGCAGSGKTMLAAETARRMVRLGRRRVLLTCFNRNLATWLRESAYFVDNGAMMIANYHKLCADFALEAGLNHPDVDGKNADERSAIFEEEYPALLLQAADKMDVRFDSIIVDEGQDFLPQWWTSLILLLADDGYLQVYYDSQQKLKGPIEDLPPEITTGGMPIELTENIRNTRAIHELAMQCHPSYGKGFTALGQRGMDPQFVPIPEGRSEHEVVSSVVARLVKEEKVSPSDIAVLTPLSISDGSSGWKPGETLLGQYRLVHQLNPAPHEIFCSSVSASKGLEFPVVILTELGDNVMHHDTHNQLQRLYVGMSRARSLLILISECDHFESALAELHVRSCKPGKGDS